MEKEIVVTEEGLKQLKDRLEFLIKVKRPECVEKIGIARSYGDLSENGEYQAAREEQAQIESEIMEIEDKLRHVRIIDDKDIDTSVVSLGCTVKIHDLKFDEDMTYKIVGSTESDPINGLLSNESPAGKALMGAKVGDIVTYKSINMGEIQLKVLDIKA
ncbi:MAG: transcription elongation factor GreA [Clostridia bacterium]|nr:transcription elongation factor GreA [Clostridia bacterium]